MKILITGASRGIGYATALALAQTGHQVLAIARSEADLKRLAAEAKDNIRMLPMDLTERSLDKVTTAIVEMGGLDILINNAGYLVKKPFLELTQKDWATSFEVNLFAVVELVKVCLPFLAQSQSAHILNIGSMGGYMGSQKFPGLTAYSASKGALSNLTESLAAELKSQKIAVNCLALGAVQTDMLAEAFPGYEAPVNAQEMGKYIAQFATEAQHLFNGKVLPVSFANP